MNICVVLPTYNERENIIPLISKIRDISKSKSLSTQILVVDDNSPDGTAGKVRETFQSDKNIFMSSGKKIGLGAAYIRGFDFVLNRLKTDTVISMDADFSHNPIEIPKLVAEAEKGADFVIGSRYIRGGKVPPNWNFFRKANSRWGNRFARYLAGIDDVKDCTSGFRAVKTKTIERLNLKKLKVRGYSFQMNFLYYAYVSGAKIKEVPINFTERAWGRTKLGPGDISEFMLNSLKLRFEQGLSGINKKALRQESMESVLKEEIPSI